MTVAVIKQGIEAKWSGEIREIDLKSEKRLFVTINPEYLPDAAKYLFDDLRCRFITASALQSKHGFEIYYHFSVDVIGLIINVHVVLPESKPEVESLANISVATNWIEREMHELFGIDFLNHPNLEKLISEGNWEEGEYPLRKN